MAIGKAKEIKEEGMLQKIKNPYEKSGTSEKILYEMKKFLQQDKMTEKKFYDISLSLA